MSINLIDYPIAVQAWSGCHLLWKITLYTGKIWDYLEERVANFPKNPNEISRGHNDNREEWTMSQGHLAFLFQVFGFILYGDCNVAWPLTYSHVLLVSHLYVKGQFTLKWKFCHYLLLYISVMSNKLRSLFCKTQKCSKQLWSPLTLKQK